MSVKNIPILILLALLLVFLLQNTEVVEVQFLVWKVSMSRALMLFGVLFVGFLAGRLVKGLKWEKRKD